MIKVSFVIKLKCSRCSEEYSPEEKVTMCRTPGCKGLGRLDIYYNYDKISKQLSKSKLEQRKPGVWKYKELLPIKDGTRIITLGEGNTPLIKVKRLGEKLGLKNLYVKNEIGNPTGSFKDRPMVIGVTKALEFGVKTTVTASSGNAAASLAAYSAKAGLECYAFVPETAPISKIAQLFLYGAKVARFKGLEKGEDPTVKMLIEASEKYGWYPCPSFGPFNPYQAEGAKTMSYEIIEQFDWNSPDVIFVPVGGGGLLAGNWKGFKEFYELGFVKNLPRIIAVQPEGCAPLIRAFKKGEDPLNISRWERPKTVAGGLSDPYPWDGDAALKSIRESNGGGVAVSDKEILEAQKLLAKYEGIFAEPSGVASLAGLIKMLNENKIDKDETIVVEITGSGFKDIDIVIKQFKLPPAIEPNIKELEKTLFSS